VVAALALAVLCGCENWPDDHCPGCRIVERASDPLPRIGAARALVVLVPGAFGFGEEWRAVVTELQAERVPFAVFWWRGPFKDMWRDVAALAGVLQRALDEAGARPVLVIAHSAGGLLVESAGRRVRPRPGQRMRVVAIAAPTALTKGLAPYHLEEHVNTPLGLAIGGVEEQQPPWPPGVELTEYFADDAPAGAPADPRRIYLGARVGHNESVAVAALPLVRALGSPPPAPAR
jgi:hypothetical protein